MLEFLIAFLLGQRDTNIATEAQATAQIDAARAAATPMVPAELLLAIAYNETKFDAMDVSEVRGKYFCGVSQANAHRSLERCRQLRIPFESYRQTARQLERRMTKDMPGESMSTVLRGYVCGKRWRGTRCGAYAGRVLRLQWQLKAIAGDV